MVHSHTWVQRQVGIGSEKHDKPPQLAGLVTWIAQLDPLPQCEKGHSPSSFMRVSSSRHSSTQEGSTICLCLGLKLISDHVHLGSDVGRDSLGRPATEFSVPSGIVIVNDDMGDFWIIKISRNPATMLLERFTSRGQTE
jgi:hypothetical protein